MQNQKQVPPWRLVLMVLVIGMVKWTIAPAPNFVDMSNGPQMNPAQPSLENDPCGGQSANFTLTPELWKASKIDEYLAEHPAVRNQTVAEYAAGVGLPNFFCGIGLECLAGQICFPAIGKDYLVLYAIQQWNNFMNKMYGVIASVMMLLSDWSSTIVTDFIPPGVKSDKSIFGWAIATLVFSVLGAFTGPLVPLIIAPQEVVVEATAAARAVEAAEMASNAYKTAEAANAARDAKGLESILQAKDTAALQGFLSRGGAAERGAQFPKYQMSAEQAKEVAAIMGTTAQVATKAKRRLKRDLAMSQSYRNHRSILVKRGPPNTLAYTRWSFLDVHLGRLRTRLQNFVSMTTELALSAPLYSDKGVAPSLLEGAFLAPNPSWESMLEDNRKLGTIVLLSEFFVSIGYIATIGQDTCRFKGPGGAWEGDDKLSHCDEKGVMRNIVMVVNNKLDNKLRNANLLQKKYNYTVFDLVNRAQECQTKHGVYGANNASTPVKESSICAFQLPVCDMTTPGLKERMKGKKARRRPAKACREEYKLPI